MNTETKRTRRTKPQGARVADVVYNALASLGPGWHDRESIATVRAFEAGRNKALLNTSEKAALRYLVDLGRIEQRLFNVSDFNSRFEYRVTEVHPGAPDQDA